MPAKSKAQRRFFGMVAAGVIPKPKGMSMADVKKFARTPEQGLPEHVKSSASQGRGSRGSRDSRDSRSAPARGLRTRKGR